MSQRKGEGSKGGVANDVVMGGHGTEPDVAVGDRDLTEFFKCGHVNHGDCRAWAVSGEFQKEVGPSGKESSLRVVGQEREGVVEGGGPQDAGNLPAGLLHRVEMMG